MFAVLQELVVGVWCKGVGPKLHYGIQSIEEKLGKKDFWRVRIGVDNRTKDKEQRTKGEQYVLQNFSGEEKQAIDELVSKIVQELVNKIGV